MKFSFVLLFYNPPSGMMILHEIEWR